MSEPQYRYNPKTLRYERAGFSIWRAIGSLVGYASIGFLFFVGLNIAQNELIETPLEKSLSAENKALRDYKVVLTSQLEVSNATLASLKTDESQLNEKLFKAPAEKVAEVEQTTSQISSDDWSESMSLLNTRTTEIKNEAVAKNSFFGDRLSISKSEMPVLLNLPSIAPVASLTEKNLVSGFGARINPFHKGNYHHDGIDVALPRGTEVHATGAGRVVSMGTSQMEAGFGSYVEIEHGFGLVTRYAHLDHVSVTWGQKITQGQVIGLSGSTGGSVAPHLHYEIMKYGKSVDPLYYLVEGISAAEHQKLAEKSKVPNQSLD